MPLTQGHCRPNPLEIQRLQRTYRDYKRNIGATEIACAMSHAAAYREVIKAALDGAIILEDDAIVDDRFRSLFYWLKDQNHQPQGLWLLGGGEYLEKSVVKNYFDFAIVAKTPAFADRSWGATFRIEGSFDRLARACGYFVDTDQRTNRLLSTDLSSKISCPSKEAPRKLDQSLPETCGAALKTSL